MTQLEAIEIVRELGNIYAVALAEKGHDIGKESDLMNGIVAYHKLTMKGEVKDLDVAVDKVIGIAYECAVDLIKEKSE